MLRALEIARHALGGLRRAKLRSSLVALGVAIASGALVSMIGFALGVEDQATAPIRKLGLLSQIRVMAKEGGPVLDDAAIDRLAGIEGVMAAWPDFRVNEVVLRNGAKETTARAIGIPREVGLTGILDAVLVAGKAFSLDDAGPGEKPRIETILGTKVATALGFADFASAVGATVEVDAAGVAPSEGGGTALEAKKIEMTVAGVMETPVPAFVVGFDVVLVPVDVARSLPGAAGDSRSLSRRARTGESIGESTEAIVRTANPADVPRVDAEIAALGYETRTTLENFEDMKRFFLFLDVLLAAVGTVALVVAGLGILNTELMSVLERFPEIGVYKAIGASDGDVRILFLSEAAAVGLLGGLAGLVLARGVTFVLEIAANAYARSQGVEGPIAVFSFPAWLMIGAVLFSVAISVGSGLYPASRAARVDPVKALRAG